jgi:hypothetical protein
MLATASPLVRPRRHDVFETVHRFGGWTLLLASWAALWLWLALTAPTSILPTAVRGVPFWALALVTVSVALPWLRLRRVPVTITRPSSHVALAEFDYGVTPFAGSSTSLSRSPLLEWHSFANVPSPGRSGFRLTISRAGDWTGSFIDDAPDHVWVRGIPTAGVGNIDKLFRKVLWVATGSGIGPCLPHLFAGTAPAHLVWSTRSPVATYGDELVGEILAAQPEAVIWDTSAQGKPDLVSLAVDAFHRSGAEAVICISNQRTTWAVVEAFERRGVPAFGAIWDS